MNEETQGNITLKLLRRVLCKRWFKKLLFFWNVAIYCKNIKKYFLYCKKYWNQRFLILVLATPHILFLLFCRRFVQYNRKCHAVWTSLDIVQWIQFERSVCKIRMHWSAQDGRKSHDYGGTADLSQLCLCVFRIVTRNCTLIQLNFAEILIYSI